jgi:hypothetical protein
MANMSECCLQVGTSLGGYVDNQNHMQTQSKIMISLHLVSDLIFQVQ